jgi:hypothetical protein
MRDKSIRSVVFALAGLLLSGGAQGQIKSESGHAWLVRYHEDDKHNTGDIAFRLEVTDKTGSQLTAKFARYDDTTGSGSSKAYKARATPGMMELKGKITKNEDGGDERKHEHFLLAGMYYDKGAPHQVTIQGYYHTGKKKNAGGGSRDDDRLCIRIRDKDLTSSPARANEPCDEQPPDEDVLTDEVSPDPPLYNP